MGDPRDAAEPVPEARRPRRAELTRRQRRHRRAEAGAAEPRRRASPRRRRRRHRSSAAATSHRSSSAATSRRSSSAATSARRRRRRSRARAGILIGLLVLASAGVFLAVSGLADRAAELVSPSGPDPLPPDPVGVARPGLLVVTHDGSDPSSQVASIVVLAHDESSDEGTVVLVPAATVVDVPGHGSLSLDEAFAAGQAPLVDVTLTNLLGVGFGATVSLTESGWAALLEHVGGFELEVSSRLLAPTEGGGEVRFEAGLQFLDGPRLAEYLTLRQPDELELEALSRVQQVVLGLLDALGEDPGLLDEVFDDGAPMLTTGDLGTVRMVLGELAEARVDDRVTTLTLPVVPLGSGREDRYRPDAERVQDLVAERLAGLEIGDGAGTAVQILNGNGVPAIGQRVAERLSAGDYRIVLTGNADSFDHPTTRIVVYDDSDAQLAIARDVQRRLGVGEIQRSATPQSVVDVTVVVGADFVG